MVTLNTRLTDAELQWQMEFTALELVIGEDREWGEEHGVKLVRPPKFDEDVSFEVSKIASSRPQSSFETIQSIVFTSGTTGRPKAVPITFGQHFFSATASAFNLGVELHDLWLSCLPLYHVGGMAVLFRSCLYGTAVDLHARFDIEEINRAVDTKPITLISLVPTMLLRLINARESWPSSLRLVLLGGAATTPELIARAEMHHLKLSVSYGMTEAASQIATLLPDSVRQKPGCVGRPLLFGQIKIVAENGKPAATSEYGEIWVTGPNITHGYLDQPQINAQRFVDGWFKTGDIGYLDEDGDLWLVQRRSDLIISGGENVYPVEVERALRQHLAIADVCVVGVPDLEWGQIVAAMVVVEPGQSISAKELEDFGRGQLAGYKIPRLIDFVSELPRTASGKIARQTVVDQLSTIHSPQPKF